MRNTWRNSSTVGWALGCLILLLAAVGAVALAGAGPNTAAAQASGGSGDLYFTTFNPPTVQHVVFTYHHGLLRLSRPAVVARPPGADGILFGANGQLLVGGQNTGNVYSIDLGNHSSAALASGVPGSFHLALSPDGHTVYTSGEPGPLGAIPLGTGGGGHAIDLRGDQATITGLAFGPGGAAIYTASPPSGLGTVGQVDLATGATHRLFSGVGAHGVFFDPYTDAYLVAGGDTVMQLPASDPGKIVSELIVPGAEFDQGSATGRGQLLLASNDGTLVFIDYSTTRHVGDVANKVVERHLVAHLDDVAPLVGPGTRPVATSAHLWRTAGTAALGTAAALLFGFVGVLLWRRARRPHHHLPRWDRRRQS